MMSHRTDSHQSPCVSAPLQSTCRQRPYYRDDSTTDIFPQQSINPSSASPFNLSAQSYTHAHAMNTPMTSQTPFPHSYIPRPLVHPGYFGHSHPSEHTIHHTPSHLSTHAHQSMPRYPESFRTDLNLGRSSSDYSKPLTISTTFHNGFPGNSSSFPFH